MATIVGKMCGYLRGGAEESDVFPKQYGSLHIAQLMLFDQNYS